MNPEMKQELVWMPPHPEGRGSGTIPFSYNGLNAPNRVWTLYHEDKEENPPKLPIEPHHLVNAFIGGQCARLPVSVGRVPILLACDRPQKRRRVASL